MAWNYCEVYLSVFAGSSNQEEQFCLGDLSYQSKLDTTFLIYINRISFITECFFQHQSKKKPKSFINKEIKTREIYVLITLRRTVSSQYHCFQSKDIYKSTIIASNRLTKIGALYLHWQNDNTCHS